MTLFHSDCYASKNDDVQVGSSIIAIRYDGEFSAPLKTSVKRWVSDSARAVAHYYGEFPVKTCTVLLHATDGGGVGVASAEFQNGKVVLDVPLGVETESSEFDDDWILTHEMVHLAFPLVWDKDRWLAEGMATYVEPIARMQVGKLSSKSVWSDMYFRCPSGLARNASEKFSQSRRIDRLYWGGATFCLMLDMELRRQSNNKYGLQQALAIVTKSGANFNSELEPRDALALADKALGVNTLVRFYDKHVNSTENPDLKQIFSQLGVVSAPGKSVRFDDNAPLADVRLRINSGN